MKPKPPIYVLEHGIEVIAEYAARGANKYVRIRIRPHRFFPDAPVVGGGCYVRRNRAVMSSMLGRALLEDEHVHHINEDRTDDSPENLELLSQFEHNSHHKTGARHTEETKQRIGRSLASAIRDGRRLPPSGGWTGKTHSPESRSRMSRTRKELIASGQIVRATPPSWTGKQHSDATKEKQRQARIAYWSNKKESMT